MNEGRRGRNVRLVEFDVATGLSGRLFIYQLEDRAVVNVQVDLVNPDPAAGFGATVQGRGIGVSEVRAINHQQSW